jgi:membrane-bound lytic murein transglycosylase C
MTSRRQLITRMLQTTALMAAAPGLLASDFTDYVQRQQQGVKDMQLSWQAYRQRYLQAWQAYRAKLARVWSEPQLPSQKVWVEYSDDLRTRRELDFARNELRLSFAVGDDAQLTEQRIRAEFERVMQQALTEAARQDVVMRAAEPQQTLSSGLPLAGGRVDWKQVGGDRTRSVLTTPKGEVITITIPLAQALPDRSHQYLPLVQRYARKWQTEPALVLAIMETESAFNPLARSHIPAFGLMQIVPASAGRDASLHAYGRERLLSGTELCTPQVNIELGCAYLNLLDSRYLRAVSDPASRLFCVIAAYNTGAGNVARAFSGNTSVADAARKINRMTSQQVYAHLRAHLKYEEARNYLYKVTKALQSYRG